MHILYVIQVGPLLVINRVITPIGVITPFISGRAHLVGIHLMVVDTHPLSWIRHGFGNKNKSPDHLSAKVFSIFSNPPLIMASKEAETRYIYI